MRTGVRRRLGVGLAAGAAALLMVALWWTATWPTVQQSAVGPPDLPARSAVWLRSTGDRIVDGRGRTVLLRGFNDDALLDHRNAEPVPPTPLDDTDAELMRRAGFDVVRLSISWSLLEGRRHQVSAGELDRIEAAVHLLARHGLRVVLDMHVGIGWGPSSEIPAWASVPLVPDWRPLPVAPWKYSVSPQVAAAETYFWTSDDWQRDFADTWRAVAARFRDDPMVAGYDLYNEPHPLPLPPGVFENRFLWPFYARLITRIGQVDPNHLFIVEGTLFDELPTAVEPLRAPNLVYSTHLYAGSLVTVPLRSQRQSIEAAARRHQREAAALPAPPWVGELGVDSQSPQAEGYTRVALASLDAAGAGWAWWQWRQDEGWGVRSRDGRRLDTDVLRRLATPYLRAAPAGVSARPAAGGRALVVRMAGRTGVPAVVAWPELLLGRPAVRGGCLESTRWVPASSSLALTPRPGTACTVRVQPA